MRSRFVRNPLERGTRTWRGLGGTGRFAAFYASLHKVPNEMYRKLFRGEKNVEISLGDFQEFYTYVGTFSGSSPDAIFQMLQDGGGGLGNPGSTHTIAGDTMQRLVIKKAGHTSMSVGDILADLGTGEVVICQMDGWGNVDIL